MAKPQITIVGHVGRDPKPGTTSVGTPIVTFPVAEDHYRWDGRARQWERMSTSWFHVTCKWGLSEHVLQSVHVGDPVVVLGRLKIGKWVDTNGVEQVTAQVDATSVGHDLRRGFTEFAKDEKSKTTKPANDEEDEISRMLEAPPSDYADPFVAPGNGSAAVPPAEPPVSDDDGSDGAGDEGAGYGSDFPDGDGGAVLVPA